MGESGLTGHDMGESRLFGTRGSFVFSFMPTPDRSYWLTDCDSGLVLGDYSV